MTVRRPSSLHRPTRNDLRAASVANESSDSERRHRHPVRFLFLLLLLGAAVHVLLPQITTLSHSLAVLRGWTWWITALAVLAQASSYGGSGYLLRACARLFGARLSLSRAVMIAMAASSVGLLWGGQITSSGAAFRWLRQRGLPATGALLAGWMPAVINIFTLSAVSVVGLVYLLLRHELPRGLAIAFVGAVSILIMIGSLAVAGWRNRDWLTRMVQRATRITARMRRQPHRAASVTAGMERLFSAGEALRNHGWKGPLSGDVLNVAFDMLTLYLLFVAAGYPINPGLLVAGYGLPLLLGKLSPLPGGVGVVEGSMAAIYALLGVPSAVTILVILGYRILSFWVPVSLGFPLAFVLDNERS